MLKADLRLYVCLFLLFGKVEGQKVDFLNNWELSDTLNGGAGSGVV